MPFFVAFFFVATDLTSFRAYDLRPPTTLVLPSVTATLRGTPRSGQRSASCGFFVRVKSTVRSMNFWASLIAPSTSYREMGCPGSSRIV